MKSLLRNSLIDRLAGIDNPSMTVGAAAGTGATVSANGNDAIGQINLNTGTSTETGNLFYLPFTCPYIFQPFVFLTPLDQPPFTEWYSTIDQDGFNVWASGVPAASTNFPFSYLVVERPWLMSAP
jgi:hypothetical protein